MDIWKLKTRNQIKLLADCSGWTFDIPNIYPQQKFENAIIKLGSGLVAQECKVKAITDTES